MSWPQMPDNENPIPAFGAHPADATVARIAQRVRALPPDHPLWQEAAVLNTIQRPLAAALGRGEIDWAAYQQRLRIATNPVLARAGDRGSEILAAATLLLEAEAAAHPRPNCPN